MLQKPSRKATPNEVSKLLAKITPAGELLLNDMQLQQTPVGLICPRFSFKNLLKLNLAGNLIVDFEEDVCRQLQSLEHLDLRNNKLKTVSPHIKAMMSLK
jgi:Leucine-rich repeat (LRR) protein